MLPLFSAMAQHFPATEPLLDAVRGNLEKWVEADAAAKPTLG